MALIAPLGGGAGISLPMSWYDQDLRFCVRILYRNAVGVNDISVNGLIKLLAPLGIKIIVLSLYCNQSGLHNTLGIKVIRVLSDLLQPAHTDTVFIQIILLPG